MSKQVLSVEKIESYVEKIKLHWDRFHESASKPVFPSDRKDVCVIMRKVGENVPFEESWRSNAEVACFKKSFEGGHEEILLVWKTKDGNIQHCTVISNAFDGGYIRIHGIKSNHNKIVVDVYFKDKRGIRKDYVESYTYSPWGKIPEYSS